MSAFPPYEDLQRRLSPLLVLAFLPVIASAWQLYSQLVFSFISHECDHDFIIVGAEYGNRTQPDETYHLFSRLDWLDIFTDEPYTQKHANVHVLRNGKTCVSNLLARLRDQRDIS